jgi:hypothetical protein
MPLSDEQKTELLKPFQEKVELADGFIEEIREKLGAENATLINDSLLGLRGTITEANTVFEEAAINNFETQERNKKLADVNNDLYIKNSEALKGAKKPEPNANDLDEDDALDAFAESVIPDIS